MAKYYIKGQGAGSLAVEKFLDGYFRENYEGALVDEGRIDEIVAELKAEQDRYFVTHRGRSISIGTHKNYLGEIGFISIGQVSYVLNLVKKELL